MDGELLLTLFLSAVGLFVVLRLFTGISLHQYLLWFGATVVFMAIVGLGFLCPLAWLALPLLIKWLNDAQRHGDL